ncbi:porin [Acidithiobacillus sp. IBUN Pt1247-S3]|uniref:porin n=1 Tax=Acidithiobacillus sp. IBUN Pt1247-S3 TaxID=3166642 RepID=UPI0034E4B5EB
MSKTKPLLLSGIISTAIAVGFLCGPSAEAANWFALQGISPPTAPLFGVSGFIEPTVWAQPGTEDEMLHEVPHINLIGPDFSQGTTAGILRARIMFRGNLNPYISYFVAGEFGNNGVTRVRGGYQPALIDGHVTFSYLPGARVEVGLVRAPSAEGAMQGFMTYNYVLSPTVVTQLMNQPMFDSSFSSKVAPTGSALLPGTQTLGVNGFRYPGAMVFDWFRSGHWEFAYGAMLGMYGTVAAGNQSNEPMEAVRLQEAYILGGKGPFRSDIQGGIWYQHAAPRWDGVNYDMNRYGVDLQYLQGYMHPWGRQLRFEYIHGNGWIDAPAAFSKAVDLKQAGLYETQLYPGISNKAWGYMAEAGLFLTKNIEVNLRYDYYNRLPNNPVQNRIFKTYALGVQYHFTPLTKIMAGYYFRTLGVPHPNATSQSVANSVDNVFALQAMIAF